MTKTGFLLFSGANFRAIITLCRHAKKWQIPFYIFAIDPSDPIFNTAYKDQVVYTRKSHRLSTKELKPQILQLIEEEGLEQLILCPTSEFLNTFFLANRTEIADEHINIPLVEKTLYQTITNKVSFTNQVHDFGLKVPRFFDFNQHTLLPFVAKPKKNVVAGRTLYPYLIFTEAEKASFLAKEDINDFFFQEFIAGQSYYLFYYINQEGVCTSFSQKNLAQQPDGKSIIYAESATIHSQTIGVAYQQLLEQLHFRGIVMIEIIKREQEYYLIEANPRFWGPFKLVAQAKPSFIHAFFQDYCLLPNEREKPTKEKYLWFGGFIAALNSSKPIKWYQKKPSFLYAFLIKHLKNDVYFKFDTINYFYQELKKIFRGSKK